MEASSQPAPRVIEPGRGGWFPDLTEIAKYRDLIYYLARREVTGRYAQSAVGVFWAILQPILLAAVFSLFLGHYAKIPSLPDVPYPVFAVSGMVLWLFIAGSLQTASGSTVINESLISKVYFPRMIIPFTYLFPALVDFLFAFAVVIATMLLWGVAFHPQVLLVPVIVLVAFGTVLGASLWLSAVNVKYRDVHQVVPFMIMVGLFISPIIYPDTLVPDSLEALYALNPVAGLMEAYHWALFATPNTSVLVCLVPVAECILLLITGAAYFQRAERSFADVI
jgi:homopolymeric O-antigen transport system permease protein